MGLDLSTGLRTRGLTTVEQPRSIVRSPAGHVPASLNLEAAMDLFRVHAQVVQLVMKMLLVVVSAALFLTVRLVIPVVRSAVVALVRFPAVVADRRYDLQRSEIEWLLAEDRRAAKANAKVPAPSAQLFPAAATVASDAGSSVSLAQREPDGHAVAAVEPLAVRTATPAPDSQPERETTPAPIPEATPDAEPEDRAQPDDEGPVLRYRPNSAPSD